jgi:hypothetical protein
LVICLLLRYASRQVRHDEVDRVYPVLAALILRDGGGGRWHRCHNEERTMKAARGLRAGMTAMALGAMLGGAAMAQDDMSCELVPLELPLLGGTPVAVIATPSPQASPAAGSLSEDEARDILEMYAACTNTGDPTLVWAMFTPRWFSQTFADPEEHYLPAFEQMLHQDSAPTGAPLELVEVIEIESREGMVDVTATFRSGDQEWTDRLTLAEVDGQWLIDEVELIDPASETLE